jgi:hypothetical protein
MGGWVTPYETPGTDCGEWGQPPLIIIKHFKLQKMQNFNFNAEVGLGNDTKFISVNGGNFTATGNFMAQSLNGDECFIPAKVMAGAGIDKETVKFPFYVIAKTRTHKWHVDKSGNIVSNPSPEEIAAKGLIEKSIVDRLTGTIIFKTKEDAAANFTELKSGQQWIAKTVAKKVAALDFEIPATAEGKAQLTNAAN